MKEKRLSRKERGLCSNCNNPPRTGKTQCQECADKAKARRRKERRRGECLQVGCHVIPSNGVSRCKKHARMRSEYDKEQRKKRSSDGLCAECGKKKSQGTKLCSKCKKSTLKRQHKMNFGGNRTVVLERDGRKCVYCLKQGPRLSVHHIDGSGSSAKVNNSPDNLITLCTRCHADIHRLGNKNTRALAAAILAVPPQSGDLHTRETPLLDGWKKIRNEILERDGYGCVLCPNEGGGRIIVHHMDDAGLSYEVPNNNKDNLIALCRGCHSAITNLRKGDRDTKLARRMVLALGPGTTGTPSA